MAVLNKLVGVALCTLLALPAMAQPLAAGATPGAGPSGVASGASAILRKFNIPPVAKSSRLDVVYLGAEDCRFCQLWEFGSRVKLLESREAAAFTFHEIKNDTLSRPMTAKDYPAELQWVHKQVGTTRGVPRFLLAIDGRVVLNSFGTGEYKRNFLPALNEMVRLMQQSGGKAGT